MNRSRLIATTDLSGLSPVLVDGAVAPAHYERLKKAVETEEPELWGLFAEPVLGAATPTGFKNAAWYGAVGSEPTKLTDLTGAARTVALENLGKSAEALLPLFADPSLRSWLRAAFMIPDQDCVRVWENRVILVNWGFVPAAIPQTDAELEQHFTKTLGALLGWEGLPKVVDSHHVTVERSGIVQTVAPTRQSATEAHQPIMAAAHVEQPSRIVADTTVVTTGATRFGGGGHWPLIAAGLSLFLIGVIVGLLLTFARSSGSASVSLDPDTAAVVEATHEGLLGERDRLSKMLSEDVCRLPPESLPGRILNRPPQATQNGRMGGLQQTPANPPITAPPPNCQRAERPAQLMLVMDTSGSMQFPAGNRPDLVQMERESNAGDIQKSRQLQALANEPGRKRMDDARDAATDFINALPTKVAVGIASFSSSCNAQIDLAPSVDRAQAKLVLDGFKGHGPTPIATALRLMKEGFGTSSDQDVSRSVVVITDGQETCKGDPCAEAKELASTYPNIRIHVIDVTGASQLQCLADATHGTMSRAGDIADLKKAVAQAAADIGREVTCDSGAHPQAGQSSQQGQSSKPAEPQTAEKLDQQAAADPSKTAPPPEKASPLQNEPKSGALTLNDQLEGATALILAPHIGSMGSGFFIAPDMLVTSRHVVHSAEGGASSKVLVTSKSLQRMYEGAVIAESNGSLIGGRDYAVVRLQEVPARPPIVLPIAQAVDKRVTVIASGYPGYLVRDDPAMQRLAKGDQSAAPELVLSEGRVQVTHKSASGVPIIAHSADISQGNSGGPLVDSCGRIVAINTFISTDPQSGRRGLFSLGGSDLTDFLKTKGIAAQTASSPCAPN